MPRCVMCGQRYHPDADGYVDFGGDAVCEDKCKWEFIEGNFTQYLKEHNIAQRLADIAAKPDLDAIIALKRELVDAGSDETGQAADINLVNSVVGPLYDAEDVLQRGLTEYLPGCLTDAIEGVDAAVNKVPIFSDKDKGLLKDMKIRANKD